ncbi:hypothetical protein [Bdellovibrio sp. GT3]|uniref:hypothetical protein n=1 Tax=Bdellovibrio sp. GT3 TaxID=3136282 RepID=UPI0030F2290D
MKLIAKIVPLFLIFVGCQHNANRNPSSTPALSPRFKEESISSIANRHNLIVVHATTEFDPQQSAAKGIDKLVKEFKASGRPVIYLVSDQTAQGYDRWYTADRNPDFEIFSEGGEHNLPINTNEVTIVGGFWGSTDTLNGCHALAMKDAIRMHFEKSKMPLTIHIPLNATYFYSEWTLFRQEMLSSGDIDLSAIPIDKYPFATLFFLRDDSGAGDNGNEQTFVHSYNGRENKKYRAGENVSRANYQFRFYINNKLIESVTGPGQRIVNIKFETI